VVSLCAHCGQPVDDRGDLCAYHIAGGGDDWPTGNGIMCDFVHREVVSVEILSLESALAV